MHEGEEKWVPSPKQLEMIDEAIREKNAGLGYTEAEARAEVERRVKLLDLANSEQSA